MDADAVKSASSKLDGVAYIKAKYVLPIPNTLVENRKVEPSESIFQNIENEFPNKKKRTGKNQNRPKLIKELPGNKLCRNYWSPLPGKTLSEICPYDNCCYSHDVKKFLESKADDIGEKCHSFATYGFCPYGVVCRFGSSHIVNGESVINEDKYKICEKNPSLQNKLKNEVKVALRKKNYDFSKALNTLREVRLEINTAQASQIEGKGMTNSESLEVSKPEHIEDLKRLGPASDEDFIPLRPAEKKKIDWKDKLYLAPLTTLGNVPYRRVCKKLGADITCSEMAVSSCLLQGKPSEWALVKRHSSEDLFGVQLCGSKAEMMIKCAQLLEQEISMDFVDINMGCPIDLIYRQGAGSALLRKMGPLKQMVLGINKVISCPLTLKMRSAIYRDSNVAHSVIEKAKLWDVSLFTVHGRSKEQRYLKLADWDYIRTCASAADPIPLFGNGDVFTYDDYVRCKNENVAGIMIARGALMKPWIFTEIKERRQWDISSSERMDILREYANNGLEHWGSDTEGIEKTRRFLLEWISFLYRYIPVGLLERPQRINERPPLYFGRDDLETLMASNNVKDWIKLSEMLLGPVPQDFVFLPKHKANSWG